MPTSNYHKIKRAYLTNLQHRSRSFLRKNLKKKLEVKKDSVKRKNRL